MLLAWDERYSIGIASVDYEHRELIRLINEAYERARRPSKDHTVAEALGAIHDRISAHFALEERLMREERYADYAAHKADHERLLEEIRDIMDEHEQGALFSEQALAERLGRWFSVHFQTHDAAWHRHRKQAV